MNEVTPGLVDDLKARLHISHGSEDGNLERLLSSSLRYVERNCGVFDIHSHEEAQELVLERARYAYNDSLEFFEENFLSMIQGLSLSLLPASVEDGEAL